VSSGLGEVKLVFAVADAVARTLIARCRGAALGTSETRPFWGELRDF